MTLNELMPESEYAAFRDVTVRTIRRERAQRKGPPFIKIGKKIYYRPESIERWLIVQEQTPVRSGLVAHAI